MLKLYIYNVEVLYLNCWARVIKMLDVLEKNKNIAGQISFCYENSKKYYDLNGIEIG